jgi:hypothetical protein
LTPRTLWNKNRLGDVQLAEGNQLRSDSGCPRSLATESSSDAKGAKPRTTARNAVAKSIATRVRGFAGFGAGFRNSDGFEIVCLVLRPVRMLAGRTVPRKLG